MSPSAKEASPVKAGTTLEVPWTVIRPFPDQPRTYFDQEELLELARSIGRVGQLLPALVCRIDDPVHQYELIDGQRRWHAVQLAEIETLRVEMREVSGPDEQFLLSFVANCGRANNTPMEYARGCGRLKENGATLQEIADTIGRSVGFVQQHLLFLDLHPSLQARLEPNVSRGEQMTKQLAVLLAQFPHEEQLKLFEKTRGEKAAKARLLIVQAMHDRSKLPPVPAGGTGTPSRNGTASPNSVVSLGRPRGRSEILSVVGTGIEGLQTSIELWDARGDLKQLPVAAAAAPSTAKALVRETKALQEKLSGIVTALEGAISTKG